MSNFDNSKNNIIMFIPATVNSEILTYIVVVIIIILKSFYIIKIKSMIILKLLIIMGFVVISVFPVRLRIYTVTP